MVTKNYSDIWCQLYACYNMFGSLMPLISLLFFGIYPSTLYCLLWDLSRHSFRH